MSFRAFPPDLFCRPGDDLRGLENAVFGRMPLLGKRWVEAGQAVGDGDALSPAHRAAAAAERAATGRNFPFVVGSFRAFPPHFLPGAHRDLMGLEVAVSGGMPLRQQLGIVGNGLPFDSHAQVSSNGTGSLPARNPGLVSDRQGACP